jgi:hypothetical protein
MIRASAGLSVVTLASITPPVTRDRERWFAATTVVLTANPDAVGKMAMNAPAAQALPQALPQAQAPVVIVTAILRFGMALQLANRLRKSVAIRWGIPVTILFVNFSQLEWHGG